MTASAFDASEDDNLFGPAEPAFQEPDGSLFPATAPAPPTPPTALAPLDEAAERDLAAARRRCELALPETGWIAEYVRAMTPITSSPVEFHLAAGVAVVSALLGNRVFIDTGWQQIYPHLWTVIVARSGFMNKSTSINLAERLVRQAGLDIFYPTEASREKALEEFASRPSGVQVLHEFGSFLANAARDYQSGYLEQLTALYDTPDEFSRSTKSGGKVVINRPAISIFGASTVDWLEDRLTPALMRGGFVYRTMFITAHEKATERDFTRLDQNARNRLVQGINRISQIGARKDAFGMSSGPVEVKVTDDARELMSTWSRSWEKEALADTSRGDLIGFAVRLRTAVYKLAMVYQASSAGMDPSLDGLTIQRPAVESAIAFVRLVWRNTISIFDEDFAPDKEARVKRTILEKIGRGCSRSDLIRRLGGMKARDLDQWIETLKQSDEVIVEHARASERGLNRQRNTEVLWYAPGPNAPINIQSRRRQPKPEWVNDWEKATAEEAPIDMRPKRDAA